MNQNLFYRVQSNNSFETTTERFEQKLQEISFGVLAKLDLANKMVTKGFDFTDQFVAYEICHPGHAYNMLQKELQMKYLLPCKITISSEDDAVYLGMVDYQKLDLGLDEKTIEQMAQIMTLMKELMTFAAN